jgi:mono/diheme cytochrome c family protein
LARGALTYDRLCATCHQADGRGINGKLAADFVGDASRLAKTDGELAQSIKNGVPNTAMRAFSPVLDDAQIRDVLAFIRGRFGAPR